MAVRLVDPFAFLIEHIPGWIADINILVEGTSARRCSSTVVKTPELTIHAETIPSHSDLEPGHFSQHFNIHSSVSQTPPIDPYKAQNATTVLYCGIAQKTLSDLVDDIARAINLTRKIHRSDAATALAAKLRSASDYCEQAAFQMLRDGECRPQTDIVKSYFEDVFTECRQQAALPTGSKPLPTLPAPPTSPALAMSSGAIEIGNNDDDSVDMSALRLTSRIGRR